MRPPAAEKVPTHTMPDAEFDRAWACAALSRTLAQLQTELELAGRSDTFTALKPWLAGEAQHGATLAVATQLGISETAVRVQVSRLRKRMRVILEQTLAETLAPGGDVREELRHLLSVFC
jgi:RNA polymerase sigma-70 factor (ECF subfamily)